MATHIKFLVEGFLKKRKKEGARQERIEDIVSCFLDDEAGKYIYLKKITGAEVVFYSGSSNFTYDLKLKREKLLKEIQKEFPEIKKIKITMM